MWRLNSCNFTIIGAAECRPNVLNLKSRPFLGWLIAVEEEFIFRHTTSGDHTLRMISILNANVMV